MTADEVRTMRDKLIASIPEGGKTPDEVQFRDLSVVGIMLVGELLLDIKRIADTARGQ